MSCIMDPKYFLDKKSIIVLHCSTMYKDGKTWVIQARISDEEKKRILVSMKKRNCENESQYLRQLIREDIKK